jgi:acetyl esterase/lipase
MFLGNYTPAYYLMNEKKLGKKCLLASAFFLVVLASCNKSDQDGVVAAKTELNVSYGSSAEQKMDIYLPAGRSAASTPAIVLIHGGAWNSGDKGDFADYIDTLKRRLPNYAIFNINYRLANSPNLFPVQENDVRASIQFIHDKLSQYQVSNKMAFLGVSAGAHLALLQAYKNSTPVRPKAVVDLFGPTDLVDLYNNPPNPLVTGMLASVVGGTPVTIPALYQQSSPINAVNNQCPPTIIFHGLLDIVVTPSQSTALRNRLNTQSVPNTLVTYAAEGHGWIGAPLTDTFDRIVAFIKTYVQ